MQSEESRQVPASVLIQDGVYGKPSASQPASTLSEAEKVTLPSRALFLLGLLVFPIFIGIISSSLLFLADDSDLTYESYDTTLNRVLLFKMMYIMSMNSILKMVSAEITRRTVIVAVGR